MEASCFMGGLVWFQNMLKLKEGVWAEGFEHP